MYAATTAIVSKNCVRVVVNEEVGMSSSPVESALSEKINNQCCDGFVFGCVQVRKNVVFSKN